jgi:hypothetical protein
MSTLVALVFGVMLGMGASKLHPRVSGGLLLGAGAGAIGGLLGSLILGPFFAGIFSDVAMAGVAAGAAAGGIVLSLVAGYAWNRFRGA